MQLLSGILKNGLERNSNLKKILFMLFRETLLYRLEEIKKDEMKGQLLTNEFKSKNG